MNKPPRAGHGSRPGKSKSRPSRVPDGTGARLPVYLSRTILILAGFILFLPLVVSYDFYVPFVFLKSILFRIAAEAMTFLYVILAVVSSSHRPRLHRISYVLLAYFMVMLFCSLPGVSVSAWSSWWGSFARMGGMFAQLHLLAYFFVLTQTLKSEREWLALFMTSLFSSLLMGLSGLIQHLGLAYVYRPILEATEDRIMGATGNANNFAFLMVLEFFVVLWFLSRRDRKATYPFLAKIWLVLLILLDLFLVAWEASAPGRLPGVLSAGLALPPIAAFALLLHALSLFWFFKRNNVRVGSAFLGILGIYHLYWVYQSRTRFAVIGLVGSLVFISFLYLRGGASRRMKWLAAASIAIVLLVPSIVFLNRHSPWVQGQPALARLTTVSFADAAPRLMAWKAGVQGVLDRPFLGWGLENYKNAFDLHFPPELFTALVSEAWFDRAHNMIVDVGVTTGLLGLAACSALYGLAVAALLRMWFRTKDPTNSILIAGLLLAYLIQNLLSFDTVNTDGVVFLVLAYVACLCRGEQSAFAESPTRHPGLVSIRWQGWLLIASAAAVMGAGCWYLAMRPYDSNLLLSRAIALGETLDPQSGNRRYAFREEVTDLCRRASDYQTTGRHEVREKFASYASGLAHAPSVPLEQKVRTVKSALTLLGESIRQEPSDARYCMYTASLVNRTLGVLRQSDPAFAQTLAEKNLILLQKAETLSPTRPQVYIERSKTLAWLGRTTDAAATLERAVQLAPGVKELHVDLVTLYISSGRYDAAASEWERAKLLSVPLTREDCNKVIRFYASQKQLGPIAALYREQLQKDPNDPDLLVHLAATYRDMGETESARQMAIKAAALSPQVAATLQNFLESLKKSR